VQETHALVTSAPMVKHKKPATFVPSNLKPLTDHFIDQVAMPSSPSAIPKPVKKVSVDLL
jgi:hypothetical protein